MTEFLARRMSWREAWALTQGILRDPDSHTTASLLGWSFVPGAVRATGTDLFEGYVNVNRGKNKTPYRAERPWTKARSEDIRSRVTAADREQRAKLDALLGLVKDEAATPADD